MGWRTVVVWTHPCLPKVAEPHPWVCILPGPLPCLYLADMLAHSPPLPLVIDYELAFIATEDEEAIYLALAQRDRVRRIRLYIPVLKMQKFLAAIDGEYPNLKYLILWDLIALGGALARPAYRGLLCPSALGARGLGLGYWGSGLRLLRFSGSVGSGSPLGLAVPGRSTGHC